MDAAGPLPWPPPDLQRFPVAPQAGARPSFFARVTQRPIAFGPVLFVIGWMGILFQRGVLRQLIVGAPLFEELAKLGLALFVVGLLSARGILLRLPFGWASGALFGVFEHISTYPEESPLFQGLRIAFHAATCGLSITIFTVLERFPDTRVRWGSTALSSILHAANNIGALLLAIVSLIAETDPIATAYSTLITATAMTSTFLIIANRDAAATRAEAVLVRIFPRLQPRPPEPAPASPPWREPPGP